MKNYLKNNISLLISIFILLGPILDLLTGICLHTLNINLTIGIIVRVIFLLFIIFTTVFIFKKKKLIIPYLIIGLYFILYIIGMILYKNNNNLLQEIQGMLKVFYFPILLLSLYSIKENIKISKFTLFTTLLLYLVLIFIPIIFNIGFKSYQITKAGTLGFYNSANEISGLISILTPIMFIILKESKNNLARILTLIIYFTVILMIGTKTPLLSIIIILGLTLLYNEISFFKKNEYKKMFLGVILVLISIVLLLGIVPRTNFYKNIKTHLNYLKIKNVVDVFKSEKLVDHFIFSQRITFLTKKAAIYADSSNYQKLFGIGYLKNNKPTKMIEMDYFDIFYSQGIIGFILYFSIVLYVLNKILENKTDFSYERYMLQASLFLIIVLSFFTGHIITAPSVSILSVIILLSLSKRDKKDILFADKNLQIGGIENAQVNLLKYLDYKKYNVTLVLEEKTGELLKKVNKKVIIKELKVSNHKNIVIRKIINGTRKLIFKIFNYHNYDFSCCYTTYSYSSNIIAKIASKNNSIYVHSDYSYLYRNEKDYRNFFGSRKINEYQKIIFVSNESKTSFLKYYPNLKEKTLVLNNFIDIEDIKKKSLEKITPKKEQEELFVFVGRLDDSSKKLKRAINIIKEIKNTELWIVGDGPDRKMYEDYSKNNKRVKFLGKQLNPYPYMRQADYIILTSDYEGFPVIYLEAIALNKKIITTIPTSDAQINMKDYAYIISKDEKEMIKEIKEILKEKKKINKMDLESIQQNKIKKLEEIISN